MGTAIIRRCQDRACRAEVRLARSGATGLFFALDAADVPYGTRGALVLIGEYAYTEPAAVRHLGERWLLPDADAHQQIRDGYGWHLPHKVTCKGGRRRG
jgi:hypothetical protein